MGTYNVDGLEYKTSKCTGGPDYKPCKAPFNYKSPLPGETTKKTEPRPSMMQYAVEKHLATGPIHSFRNPDI